MKRLRFPLVVSAALVASSCIGPNHAFRGVLAWNTRATDSKWWNEVLHVGMWIVPVYQLALAGDILVFNSIEFWGGNNPIKEPDEPKPVEN